MEATPNSPLAAPTSEPSGPKDQRREGVLRLERSLESGTEITPEQVLAAVEPYLEQGSDRGQIFESISGGLEAAREAFSKGVVFANNEGWLAEDRLKIASPRFGEASQDPKDFVYYLYKSKIFKEEAEKVQSLIDILGKVKFGYDRDNLMADSIGDVVGARRGAEATINENLVRALESSSPRHSEVERELGDLLQRAVAKRRERYVKFREEHSGAFEAHLADLEAKKREAEEQSAQTRRQQEIDSFDPQV